MALGPPKVMKMGDRSGMFLKARNGRGPRRSGAVEAAKEYDPERVY